MTSTGWLIEKQIAGRAVWWRGEPVCGRDWTPDANEAVRFVRQQDADRALCLVCRDSYWVGATVTDHMWIDDTEGEA